MSLVGRDLERKHLAELIDGVGDRGGALLVRGEAGIGKSALLAEASRSGVRVLSTTGAEAEQNLPYVGLHQLLYPVRAGVDALPAPQRDALRTALGLAHGAAPNVYQVGLAVLGMLAEAAAERPLLLIAEDAYWLDHASADLLAFVARRLESEPVVLVATVRDEPRSPLEDVGLPTMTLDRLPEDLAGELLDAVAPDLTPAVRARLLTEAAGNPLALTELPGTARDLDAADPVLPLTDRLERAFAGRVAPARTSLLIAALNDSTSLVETLDAATIALTTSADVTTLAPAVDAQLVELGPGTLRFRHPLMRSAIPWAASPGERQDTHRALAETLDGQLDRRAWHRVAATAGQDEGLAAELGLAADRAERRGGVSAATAALEQSARLSEAPGRAAAAGG
ncbi:hypothetical protein GCM10010174_27670 [Kutzneria viridogrisea]|uniref:Orc1-like AAA ATPase domain-containing protein n=1 Tax=Kutzneria viridogrisea TaxID=47990 RepID=A0ABR6BVB1_9PSEU|nr:hypothetical protein [Kutzneria viridogrisea]